MSEELPKGFEQKIERIPESGCWLWMAAVNHNGYGQAWFNGRMQPAHNVVYRKMVGPIPIGLELDHLCRVRCCINPYHLEPVTHSENIRRGYAARGLKTHCKHGHEFTDENTWINSKSNHRYCCACWKIREDIHRDAINARRRERYREAVGK